MEEQGLKLKQHAHVRREAFGGLILCDDSWQTVLFTRPEVVDAIESGAIPAAMQQYLVARNVLEGDPSALPAANWSQFELEDLEVPKSASHLTAPLNVALEITNRCNLACIHCANRANEVPQDELTTAEVKRLFDEWAALHVFAVTITGGEPFVRPDMVELLQYLDHLGLRSIVLTNGLLITPEILKAIPESVGLQLSIDGLGDQYEYVRGRGTFARLLRTVELLEGERRPVGATLVFTKKNSRHALEVMKFCLERGIRLKMDPLLPLGRALDSWDDLVPGKEDAELFVAARKYKIDTYKQNYAERFPNGRPFNVLDLPEIFGALFLGCEGGRTDLWVRYDGRVYPCANLSAAGEFMVGNIRESTCADIWNHSPLLRQFRETTWKDFKNCGSCDIADYCTYRCPASSLFFYGDYNTCGANDFIREVIRVARDSGITDRVDGQ